MSDGYYSVCTGSCIKVPAKFSRELLFGLMVCALAAYVISNSNMQEFFFTSLCIDVAVKPSKCFVIYLSVRVIEVCLCFYVELDTSRILTNILLLTICLCRSVSTSRMERPPPASRKTNSDSVGKNARDDGKMRMRMRVGNRLTDL